ncbi:hypothetical protein, partial [Klebsiella pneumoniae]|uniref:hypothetical protein n=1 Tax=Klebsiella pneumoniae TaxID=573 RepID=UPI003BF00A7A
MLGRFKGAAPLFVSGGLVKNIKINKTDKRLGQMFILQKNTPTKNTQTVVLVAGSLVLIGSPG